MKKRNNHKKSKKKASHTFLKRKKTDKPQIKQT